MPQETFVQFYTCINALLKWIKLMGYIQMKPKFSLFIVTLFIVY